MKYRCRFIPNLASGHLHIGHCMTYVANLLQVSKTSNIQEDTEFYKNLSLILTHNSINVGQEKLNQNLDLSYISKYKY